MPSEETPLLQDVRLNHDDVYQRFSPARKRAILALVSGCGLLPCESNVLIYTRVDIMKYSVCDWNIHTLHNSDRKGSEHHRRGGQVRRFPVVWTPT